MATDWSPFFINIYMVLLIFLNIILIVLLSILVFYIIKSNNISFKGIFKNDVVCKCDKNEKNNEVVEIDNENDLKPERVFVGRFVTDEEYQHMIKNRRSDISVLIEDLQNDYEYLKELSK